ncbi:TlpA family protein disulfide reductase [Catenovulum sp. SM1970]|uniref:TlpA family protein disulfide reductase n=1 Tax=Marinifaba aquimaris TaxID=2741323 RepID=UPI00157181A0|nr:TlpA disulfide reductase family protein [Marinifaba aquimaris]NTS78539.1 TlpA family protein disulfide reductase [Marinifaba aquimaris]
MRNKIFSIKSIKSVLYQLLFLIGLFYVIHYFQTKDLLNSDELTNTQIQLVATNNELITSELANPNKQTLVYFIAPWCGVCRHSITNVDTLFSEGRAGLEIIVIALDYENVDEVKNFINTTEISVPVYLGSQFVKEKFKVKGYPTYYLLNSDASIEFNSVGYSSLISLKTRLWL